MSKEVQPLHKILEIFNQWNVYCVKSKYINQLNLFQNGDISSENRILVVIMLYVFKDLFLH